MLRTLHPDLVLVMVGVNDVWTVPEAPVGDTPAGWQDVLWRYSRVYRLLFMLGRSIHPVSFGIDGEQIDAHAAHATLRYGATTFEVGYRAPEPGERVHNPGLLENLAAMVAIAHAAGVELDFVTYPGGGPFYGGASRILRRAAAETGTRLIDLRETFAARCADVRCPWLFPDGHPTAGCHRIAGSVVARTLGHATHAS